MYFNRKSIIEDFSFIEANQFLSEEDKNILINAFGFYKAETLLKGQEIICIATFNEFHPSLYNSGIIIKNKPSVADLKEIKRFIEYVVASHKANYVYSECVTCETRDRFHKFLGFEIEKDLDTFKKWKFKGLKY